MIKLDKYESTIVLYSKGHFDKKIKELNLSKIDVIKAMRLEHYIYLDDDTKALFYFKDNLIDLCFKHGFFSNITYVKEIFSSSFFDPFFSTLPKELKTLAINIAICYNQINKMLGCISGVKVCELHDNEKETLIELEEKDDSFLDKYVAFIKENSSEVLCTIL